MTRRMLTIKWVFYSLWTLLFLLAQQLVLPHIRVWGVHPFLLPVLAAVLIHPVFSRVHRRFAGR